jgi:predicted acylesterase/phospholipase RssA
VITPEAPDRTYSTRLRTALLLTGTGTAGAYHAGVLRALHETGIKIDLVAGRGIGAASALFAAIDGGARLWEASGIWKHPSSRRLYGWRRPLRLAGFAAAAAGILLVFPLALLAFAVIVGLSGMIATLIGLERAGAALTNTYASWITTLFAPGALPTVVPRLILLALIAGITILAVDAVVSFAGHRGRRRSRLATLARLVGAPLTADALTDRCTAELWGLTRGAAPGAAPTRLDLARKYVELLSENLGQPGFREVLLTVHDLDSRRDTVFALLSPAYRPRFFSRATVEGGARQLEAFDLAGVPRDHLLDALAAALAVPVATEPHLITFGPEAAWRGETHRLCDRPDALGRLLEEAANAGAEQIILVAPSPRPGRPHELTAGRSDLRGRAGEQLAAFEAAALRDALDQFAGRFASLFVIRPVHHPLTPLDFAGVYDERSDRVQTMSELVDRGYEDAYRQFIEPIVGAGAEQTETVHRPNGGKPAPVRL